MSLSSWLALLLLLLQPSLCATWGAVVNENGFRKADNRYGYKCTLYGKGQWRREYGQNGGHRMTAECPAKLTIRGGIFTYTSLMGPHTHTHTLGHTILSPLKNLTFFYDFHVSSPPLLLPLDYWFLLGNKLVSFVCLAMAVVIRIGISTEWGKIQHFTHPKVFLSNYCGKLFFILLAKVRAFSPSPPSTDHLEWPELLLLILPVNVFCVELPIPTLFSFFFFGCEKNCTANEKWKVESK